MATRFISLRIIFKKITEPCLLWYVCIAGLCVRSCQLFLFAMSLEILLIVAIHYSLMIGGMIRLLLSYALLVNFLK